MFKAQVKSLFFDRAAVQKALSRAERRVLSKFGSYVWTGAKSSIRNAPKTARSKRGQKRGDGTLTSQPGQPPFNRTGLLKKNIFFSFDPVWRSVVIGPARLNSTNAPAALEFGGYATIRSRGKSLRANIEARPFMTPAFKRELPKVPDMWRAAARAA